MLVFASEFPAAAGRTLGDLLDLARVWICGSPHYPWKDKTELIERPSDVVEYERDEHRVALASVATGGRSVGGLRYIWKDRDFEWVTEIVGAESAAGLWVSVTVSCNVLRAGAMAPAARKPYILKLLCEQLGGGDDGEFVVSDKPHLLGPEQLPLAESIVRGTLGCHLPIVYVSTDFSGRPSVDYVRLSKSLSGAAHVVVEPDRRFSVALAGLTDSANVYGGGVAIYWPRGSGRFVRFLPYDYADLTLLAADVESRLREAWLYAKTDRGATWAEILQTISRHKLDALRESGSAKLDDYTKEFDAENRALRDQLEQTERKLTNLQYSVQQSAQRAKADPGGLLRPGKEQDLFDGEIRDAVIAAVRGALAHTTDESRRSMIFKDLLDANAESGGATALEEAIREALGTADKVTQREIGMLEHIGFSVENGGKHYRATFGGDARLKFTIHKTPSDFRAPMNLVSEIVKKLLK